MALLKDRLSAFVDENHIKVVCEPNLTFNLANFIGGFTRVELYINDKLVDSHSVHFGKYILRGFVTKQSSSLKSKIVVEVDVYFIKEANYRLYVDDEEYSLEPDIL